MTERFNNHEALIPVFPGEFVATISYHRTDGFLLVQEGFVNPKFSVKRGDWNILTETVETTDNSLIEVVRRTIVEEVGDRFLNHFHYLPGSYTKIGPTHILLAEFRERAALIEKFEPKYPREIIAYQWFHPRKLNQILAILKEDSYGQLLRWVFPALVKSRLGALQLTLTK